MFVSRAGLAAMPIVDSVLVSRHDTHQLALLGLADGVLGRVFDVLAALVLGGLVLVARARGAGSPALAGHIWKRTLPWAAAFGLIGVAAGFAGTPILLLAGEDGGLAHGAGTVMAIVGASYPAALVALATAIFLEAVGRPIAVAVAVILGNVINLGLDWMLIFGHLGAPALGAAGAALSTTGVNVALAAALLLYARMMPGRAAFGIGRGGAQARGPWREQALLGGGAAATALVMNLLAIWLTIFAGWLGALPLAALSALFTLNGPVMLMAMGMADATSLQVAQAHGAGGSQCRFVLWSNLATALLLLCLCASVWIGAPDALAGLFTADAAQRARLAAVVPLGAGVLVLDAAGMLAVAALRGLGDVSGAVVIPGAAMAVMVPLAGSLAFGVRLGLRGLLLAVAATSLLRLVVLLLRFEWKCRPRLADALAHAEGLDGRRIA